MLLAAWDAVTTKAVVNCFWKSKMSRESLKAAIAEDNHPFQEMEEETENIRSIQPDLVSESMDAASFNYVDAEFLTVHPPPSDAEIAAELFETEDVSTDNDDAIKTEDEPVYFPDRSELSQILLVFKSSILRE